MVTGKALGELMGELGESEGNWEFRRGIHASGSMILVLRRYSSHLSGERGRLRQTLERKAGRQVN